MRLSEKVVVVTGSTRGIGRVIAEACARAGARVVICSRNERAVCQTVDTLKGEGLSVSGLAMDVAAPGDLERLLRHAVESWGRVDVWINNAGLSNGLQALDEMDPAEIDSVVAVNLNATLQACRMMIRYFIEQGGGILVNMSGRGGRLDPAPFTTVYAATKAAVTSLTKSLALENRRYPLSIHAVLPGMVATDFYREIKTSPKAASGVASIPLVLNAVGVPVEAVADLFVDIAAQEPGKTTGKIYSMFKGWRLARGIALLTWYRVTGKMDAAR